MSRSKYIHFFVVVVLSVSIIISSVFFALSKSNDIYSIVNGDDSAKRSVTVIIDAGHGGEDSGAVSSGGLLEKEINLKISENLRDILITLGINVRMTRIEDKLLYKPEENIRGKRKISDLKNRYLISLEYEDAVFVSIHANKYPVEKYKGLQVYYSKNNIQSKDLAFCVQRIVKEYLQTDNTRKIKEAGSSIYLLDRIQCPAILIESGFLSNESDCKNLSDCEYIKKMSALIANAIAETVY